jgi:predicted nucleotidyltransferase
MPVRSLSSSVIRWPEAETVDKAVREWAKKIAEQRPETVRIGYFGSYARGDWGVGSDLDLIVIVERTQDVFEHRTGRWDATELPVPADVLVYTAEEWKALQLQGRFSNTVRKEAVWVYDRDLLRQ